MWTGEPGVLVKVNVEERGERFGTVFHRWSEGNIVEAVREQPDKPGDRV